MLDGNGGTAPWLDRDAVLGRLPGLMPSFDPLLGGVRRFPTLVRVVEVGMD